MTSSSAPCILHCGEQVDVKATHGLSSLEAMVVIQGMPF